MAETSASEAEFRGFITGEIKRLARLDGGRAPGRLAFERSTGVKEHQWRGVYWAKWNDAVFEAGCQPNEYRQRFDSEHVLRRVVEAARHFGHWPTFAEMALYRRRHPGFPSDKTVSGHFPGRATIAAAVRQFAATDATLADILPMLPDEVPEPAGTVTLRSGSASDGWVYLIKSGKHYKIGRGDDLERRVKQIRVALPEAGVLVHAIRTDDPVGIEAYWHRRFDATRMNGEWFNLTTADVAAFKRRKFM